MFHAWILEDGVGYYGSNNPVGLKTTDRKPISKWTEFDRKTFLFLLDCVYAKIDSGEYVEGMDLIVTPDIEDPAKYTETELTYRQRPDSPWKSRIYINKTSVELEFIGDTSQVEAKVRQRHIRRDGTPTEWSGWYPAKVSQNQAGDPKTALQ